VHVLTDMGQTYHTSQSAADLAFILRLLGQFPQAATEAKEAVRVAPHIYTCAYNLAIAYMAMNSLDDAKKALDAAEERGLDAPLLHLARYSLAFLQSDIVAMQRQVLWASEKAQMEDRFLFIENYSNTPAYYGHVAKARELAKEVIELARHSNHLEEAATLTASGSWWEAVTGNFSRAQESAAVSLAIQPNAFVRAQAALTFALAGGTTQAELLAAQLNEEFPLDTMMQRYSIPTIRAAAVMKKDPAKAIEILKIVEPYELGGKYQSNLEPIYVRGLAYLQGGQGQQAAAEFQKIIDHPGIIVNSVHGALAHLQLGRAQVMMGDKVAARKSYQDFLTLWKDADPDIPIYKQAKSEYARLR
jgi:tetratricopeptide (TPR) repeat protein